MSETFTIEEQDDEIRYHARRMAEFVIYDVFKNDERGAYKLFVEFASLCTQRSIKP